jgi:hypothetical protein
MARTLHVYLDESGRRIDGGQVLMIGALVLPEPLGFRDGAWFDALIADPHATEIPDDAIDAQGRKQAAVLQAVADGAVPGLRFSVLAVLVARDGGKPLASHYESAYLGLVMELIARERLGAADTLVLYPERFRGGGAPALMGRFQAIAGALRWLSPQSEHAPEITVVTFPKTPDVLIGQSMVDAVLWNLGRGLYRSGRDGWTDDLARQWGRLGLRGPDHLHLSFAPDLHDAHALSQWAARRTGRLGAVDWDEVARRADTVDFTRLAEACADHADPADEVSRAMAELGVLAENSATAGRRGVPMPGVVATLEALGPVVAALPVGPARGHLERRRTYLLCRALAHLGEAAAAVNAWSAWSAAAAGLPLTPAVLEERVLGNNALSVLLTDFEAWDAVESRVAETRALIAKHRPGFDRDPLLGRCLGTLAQARILAGAADPEIPDLLDASSAQFDTPDDWSYAWTWGLVALGRAPSRSDGDLERLDRILAEAARAWGDDLPTQVARGAHPFLAWGVAEAATVPALAEHLGDAWQKALLARAEVLATTPGLGHPGIVTMRAVAMRERAPRFFKAAWWASSRHAGGPEGFARGLGTGQGVVRFALRTLPAWIASRPTRESREALRAVQHAVADVFRQQAPPLGLATRLRAIARLDPEDVDGARRMLALGGY